MRSAGSAARLDGVFRALADPIRRQILFELARGDRPVKDLVRRFAISQPAVTKHLNVLEGAGLIARKREGRERRCQIRPAEFEKPVAWVARCRRLWEERFDALEELLAEDAAKEER